MVRPLKTVPTTVIVFRCTDSYVMVWVNAESGEMFHPQLLNWN
jgi:hypothetical protein